MSFEQALENKRNDLHVLINHVRNLEVGDENGPAMKCVLSRLQSELQRLEVEAMRRHILSCPGLSDEGSAMNTALPALDEAMKLILINESKIHKSLLTPPALTPTSLGGEDSLSADYSSRDSSFASDLDVIDPNGGSMYNHSHSHNAASTTDNIITPVVQQVQSKSKSGKKGSSWTGTVLRSMFLDIPFASTVFICMACLCAKHMYFTFWEPVMETVQWNSDRMNTEYTNYRRTCDASDISTTNIDDFIIDPETTTPEEALEITNKHGLSIFPNILSKESAEEMRKWVLHRNANLSEDDEIPLISNEHRWSFPIGADEDPSVPPILREIATNVMLQESMDLIFGEDPAIVEFTAITSAYGAGDQHWHSDNGYTDSQMHYARSFVPMYSIFIPLQDTTAKMGATSACPGTHLCGTDDNLEEVCNNLNFQVHDTRGRLAKSEEDHVWKSGDGFLMHLNIYHRGPGHTDPHGEERVMLIMTISNRPKGQYFDKRQISLGTSYSNKWDMWGLTMKDLAVIETTLGFPWKQLRTYGIWKPKGNHRNHDVKWGWDYFTVACSRLINDQMGFRYEDLEAFLKKINKYGPIAKYFFGYVPEEGEYDDKTMTIDNGWREYLRETSKRFITVAGGLYAVSCFFYVLLGLLATGFRSTCSRFLIINAGIGLIFYGWVLYVSNTPWGKDIISGRAAEPIFMDGVVSTEETALPTKNDVLFNRRLHSPFLESMNVILDQQPGNANFYSLVSQYSGAFSKSYSSPPDLQRNVLQIISNKISEDGGRFLKSNANGDWFEPSRKEITSLIQTSLVTQSNPITKALYQEMNYLKSECYYGRMRSTAMMKTHTLAMLDNLHGIMFDIKIEDKSPSNSSALKHRLFVPNRDEIRGKPEQSKIDGKYEPKVGDMVEYYFDNDGWFVGRVMSVKKRTRTVAIQFNDGEYDSRLSMKKVRPFKDFRKGERVSTGNREATFVGVKAIGEAILRSTGGTTFLTDISRISRPE